MVWKTNRAQSKFAKWLLEDTAHLQPVCCDLTASLHLAPDAQVRFRILLKGREFCLQMAVAILSVFWRDEFGVYDVWVREQLDGFHRPGNKTSVEVIRVG